jgi:NADH-quinone oxidoreductase subunit E
MRWRGRGSDAGTAKRPLRRRTRGGADQPQGPRGGARPRYNASARLAVDIGDTIKRIDGTEVPLLAPWGRQSGGDLDLAERPVKSPDLSKGAPIDDTGIDKRAAPAKGKGHPESTEPAQAAEAVEESAPEQLSAARDGKPDDLKKISGVGPKLEGVLNEMGFYHFDQIAAWTPAEVAWVDARLKFKGRIERDGWIAQAAALARDRRRHLAWGLDPDLCRKEVRT